MTNESIPVPTLRDAVGKTVDEFPEGHDIPYTILLREAYMKYGDKGPTEIEIPRYGNLFIDGRKYRFEFDPKYATRKGYDSVREGVWG